MVRLGLFVHSIHSQWDTGVSVEFHFHFNPKNNNNNFAYPKLGSESVNGITSS